MSACSELLKVVQDLLSGKHQKRSSGEEVPALKLGGDVPHQYVNVFLEHKFLTSKTELNQRSKVVPLRYLRCFRKLNLGVMNYN